MIAAPSVVLLTRRSPHATPGSPLLGLGRIAWQTTVILLASALVLVAATFVGRSSLAASLPQTFLPGSHAREAGPGAGMDNGAAGFGTADVLGFTSALSPEPALASTIRSDGAAASNQGFFSGRNAPALERGIPVFLRYVGIFSGVTALVALILHASRPRRRGGALSRVNASRITAARQLAA